MAASAVGTKIWLKTLPWRRPFRGAVSDLFLVHFCTRNGPQNGPRMGPRGCPGRPRKRRRKQTQKWTQNGPRRGPQMDPRTVQNGLLGGGRAVGDEAPEAPLEPTMGQNGFKNGPGWAPRDPLGAHDGPKWLPKWSWMGPRGPLRPMGQNGTQKQSIWSPNGPRKHRNSPPRAPR